MPLVVLGLLAWTGILLFFHAISGWVPLLDSANLAFHEAGHPLFGMLHGPLGVYGGTLMQLLMPAVAAFEMRRQEKFTGMYVCVIWFAENLLNVARYMADARAKQLPLVGGIDPNLAHDWSYIFNDWGVINHDTAIADVVRLLALALMGWAIFAAWRRAREQV